MDKTELNIEIQEGGAEQEFENNFCLQMLEEHNVIRHLLPKIYHPVSKQEKIEKSAKNFIEVIRQNNKFCVEEFINRYSLSSEEGVAVMCLAEALLRIPDGRLAAKLVRSKLAGKEFERYIFRKTRSVKIIFASFGLFFAGKFADLSTAKNIFSQLIQKSGQRLFVSLVKSAIMYFSKEFVFANDMNSALIKVKKYDQYKFSFDLLGESARTAEQAEIYYKQYEDAIDLISLDNGLKGNQDLRQNHNISVKLTALYPRFEFAKRADIKEKLLPKLISLVEKTQENNLTISFDSEEAFRLDIYTEIVSSLILHEKFKNYHGIGFVVQAYNTNSYRLCRHIIALAKHTKKTIPVRLVKGAYWDTEIKRAQELGIKYYPVFTKKEFTDANYIACAKLLLAAEEKIYAQFATHNALTAAIVKILAIGKKCEFQKLYGMGNALHNQIVKEHQVRIYAPIGRSSDLLAYLMRRMLENGANTSFAGKVVDKDIELSELIYNIYDKTLAVYDDKNKIVLPENIYPNRRNAMGYELGYKTNYEYLQKKVASYFSETFNITSIIGGVEDFTPKRAKELFCPGKSAEKLSLLDTCSSKEIQDALKYSQDEQPKWENIGVEARAKILEKIANLLEEYKFEFYALLIKEGGKTINDAVAEVIEAVDFCRYYANSARKLMVTTTLPGPTGERNELSLHPRGIFLCISPWNFPLAIFVGQVVAALVAGNAVLAKPAQQTSAIAYKAIKLMHKAGVPTKILHFILASGADISKYAVSDERVGGVVFTGSTDTANKINKLLSERTQGIVPFIAETGGQNAMIVDSSALLEQVCDDVLTSAFYSAGQRCSALRVLYIQDEIYDQLFSMICRATALLSVEDTVDFSVDIGPVISKESHQQLSSHIEYMQKAGFEIFEHPQKNIVNNGYYFYPHIIKINTINDIKEENFGPILHVVKYNDKNLDTVINEINAYGYGLTFGVHSRIDQRIDYLRQKLAVGNIYANRSIVGAKVGSQPFGGQNKSGTGFKAGGPNYLLKFLLERSYSINLTAIGGNIELLKA